jgi:hypothetical protein
MSESPPQDSAQDALIPGVPSLTPDAIATVLEDFRCWLTAVGAGKTEAAPPVGEEVDLYTLVGQFTALRQEVNLQTRAVRAQQEQNAETLRQLAETVDFLTQTPVPAPPRREPSADDGVRPLLKTLVDLYDAVALAARELQRGQETASSALQAMKDATPVGNRQRRLGHRAGSDGLAGATVTLGAVNAKPGKSVCAPLLKGWRGCARTWRRRRPAMR